MCLLNGRMNQKLKVRWLPVDRKMEHDGKDKNKS